MNTRKRHSAEFKAKVAIEAARNDLTVNQIAAKHEIHPVQVSQWKKELLSGASAIFERGGKAKRACGDPEREVSQLHQKIGQLTVEVDWLKKKLNQ